MLKDALHYLTNSRGPTFKEVDKVQFADKEFYPIVPKPAQPFSCETLGAIIEYNQEDEELIYHIASPTLVSITQQSQDDYGRHIYHVISECKHEGRYCGEWLEPEDFIVALQSKFVQSEARDQLLNVVSNIKVASGTDIEDDGTAQQVSVKKGVHLAEKKQLPNAIKLAPWRTFTDIDQPESLFSLRVKENYGKVELCLFEADGGSWRADAIEHIKEYIKGFVKGPVLG